MFKGRPVSSGIGIGKSAVIEPGLRRVSRRRVLDIAQEIDKLHSAIDIFCAQIEQVSALAAENFGKEQGGIINAQLIIARDPDFLAEARGYITERKENAERAISRVLGGYIKTFRAMRDDLMRAREADFRDIRNRLLGVMAGEKEQEYEQLPEECVIVTEELPASTLAALPVERISAIIAFRGSEHSHTAILARARRIPFVIVTAEWEQHLRGGEMLIVNGGTGEVICDPTSEEVSRYSERARQQDFVRERLHEDRHKQTLTRDGRRVRISAAVNSLLELVTAMDNSMDSAFMPYAGKLGGARDIGEQQQFLAYRALIRELKGKPAIIAVPEVKLIREIPYLGAMGENIIYGQQELNSAFRAVLRASAFGKVRIAIPRVLSPTELRIARDLIASCAASLRKREINFDAEIRLGAIIENPAAAVCASSIATWADFIVLNVDALIGHTLALPNTGKKPASYGIFHPAVLRLIHGVIQAAGAESIHIVISGETAADPMLLPFLIGCGADGIGAKQGALSAIREQCGNLNHAYWAARVPEILSLSTPEEVVGYLKHNWAERTDRPDSCSVFEEVASCYKRRTEERMRRNMD